MSYRLTAFAHTCSSMQGETSSQTFRELVKHFKEAQGREGRSTAKSWACICGQVFSLPAINLSTLSAKRQNTSPLGSWTDSNSSLNASPSMKSSSMSSLISPPYRAAVRFLSFSGYLLKKRYSSNKVCTTLLKTSLSTVPIGLSLSALSLANTASGDSAPEYNCTMKRVWK